MGRIREREGITSGALEMVFRPLDVGFRHWRCGGEKHEHIGEMALAVLS